MGRTLLLFSIIFSTIARGDLCDQFKLTPTCPVPWYLKLQQQTCEYHKSEFKCDELVKAGELPEDKSITCTPYEVCTETIYSSSGSACFNAFVETIEDYASMLESAYDFAAKSVTDAAKAYNDLHAYFDACDESVDCKRELVANHPYYSKYSDTQLQNIPTRFFWQKMNELRTTNELNRRGHKSLIYLPPTDLNLVGDTKNDLAKIEKRSAWAASYDWLVKKNKNISCYNNKAVWELRCYAVFMFVDPLVAAKIVAKLPWIQKALHLEVASAPIRQIERRGLLSSEVTTGTRTLNRERFVAAYEKLEYTTVEENREWIKMANLGSKKNRKFLDIENSKLKTLNDTIKDKALVTSLTNFHKEILFEELTAFNKLHPQLHISPYSDFKSVRLAVDGNLTPEALNELEAALVKANQRFYENPSIKGLLRTADLDSSWFRAGLSDTADQANSAARFGRTQPQFRLENFSDPKIRKYYEDVLQETHQLRDDLLKQWRGTKMLTTETSGRRSFTAIDRNVFDIVRKTRNDAELREALIQQYGLTELPSTSIEQIRKYTAKVDQFSPGIHIAERSFVTFDDAIHGGIAVDFVGMGARNMKATSSALAQSRNVEEAIFNVRDAERALTDTMDLERSTVQGNMADIFGHRGPIRTNCSGDDCGGVPLRHALSAENKVTYVKSLARENSPGNYRITFFADQIKDPAVRGTMVAHGDSIANLLRQKLNKIIEPNRLRGVTFGVDMLGQSAGQGQIRLIVAKHPTVQLSKFENINIEISLRNALNEMNRELSAVGVNSNYRLGSIVNN